MACAEKNKLASRGRKRVDSRPIRRWLVKSPSGGRRGWVEHPGRGGASLTVWRAPAVSGRVQTTQETQLREGGDLKVAPRLSSKGPSDLDARSGGWFWTCARDALVFLSRVLDRRGRRFRKGGYFAARPCLHGRCTGVLWLRAEIARRLEWRCEELRPSKAVAIPTLFGGRLPVKEKAWLAARSEGDQSLYRCLTSREASGLHFAGARLPLDWRSRGPPVQQVRGLRSICVAFFNAMALSQGPRRLLE